MKLLAHLAIPALGLSLLASVAACGGTTNDGTDAGADLDGGVVADAGVRALCPLPENNPSCQAASECGAGSPGQSNCAFCPTQYTNLCLTGACGAPPLTENGDVFTLAFSVGDLQTQVFSMAGIALAAETAGGLQMTCEDVYAGRVNLDEACFNVLQSRYMVASRQERNYRMPFTRLPAERPVLLVIYGFASEGAEGQPIGISCTAEDVPPAGSGPMQVAGDMMRRIL
jgi:hypothetical protein